MVQIGQLGSKKLYEIKVPVKWDGSFMHYLTVTSRTTKKILSHLSK